MSMLSNYFKVALRNILRHKVHSAINIAGLTVGLACCLGIMLFIRFVLSCDDFQEKGDRIYRVISILTAKGQSPQHTPSVSGPVGPGLKNDYPEIENYVRFIWQWNVPVRYEGKWLDLNSCANTDSTVFKVFTWKMKSGNPATALCEPKSIVLTEETARKIFGNEDPLGKILYFPDGGDFKVTGVMEDIPANSVIRFGCLRPLSKARFDWIEEHARIGLVTFVLLKEGVDLENLQAKMKSFSRNFLEGSENQVNYYLQPLKDILLRSGHISGESPTGLLLTLVSAMGLLILVVGCVNYMNLATARASHRAREVGMRKVFGADRKRLIWQFLGESVLQAFIAMFIVLCIIELALPVFNRNTKMGIELDWLLILGFFAVAAFAGILAGSYPAFILSSFRPLRVLKGISKTGARGLLLRRIMVVAQLGFSLFLIICTLLLNSQARYLLSYDMGFNSAQVVTLPLTDRIRDRLDMFRQELLRIPSITGIAASSNKPGSVSQIAAFDFEGRNPDESWSASIISVDYDFIPFYGLKLMQGRNFSRDFEADAAGSYIINETLARKLEWDSPLGKSLGLNGGSGTVIGIIKDFNYVTLQKQIMPLILRLAPSDLKTLSLRLAPENPQETLKSVERVWSRNELDRPFKYTFLDDDISRMYQPLKNFSFVAAVAGFFSIIIGCLGLLGLISFSAQERSREIGIRKVMGASTVDVFLLMSKEYLILFTIAFLAVCPLTWLAFDIFLQNFAYRIDVGVFPFILGGLAVLIIAGSAVSWQALKAASADPVTVLHYE